MLLEDSLAAVRGEAAGEAALQEAVREGEERAVPSAPETVEEVSGKDEGVG